MACSAGLHADHRDAGEEGEGFGCGGDHMGYCIAYRGGEARIGFVFDSERELLEKVRVV